MESFNLKLFKLDEEASNEFIKDIVALSHQSGGLLLSHNAALKDLGGLKVGKEEDGNFAVTA